MLQRKGVTIPVKTRVCKKIKGGASLFKQFYLFHKIKWGRIELLAARVDLD